MLHRGRLLAEVAALKRSLAVSGTHGKTTTASMVAHVLVASGRDPGYLIGGELRSTATNAAWGSGEWVVVEADESDRSFLELDPEVAVVTSMEIDHHATYRSIDELEAAFGAFLAPAAVRLAWERIVPAPASAGPPRSGALLRAEGVLTYGIGAGDLAAERVELEPLGSRFTVEGLDVALRVPGEHNVLNALGALAACRAAGVPLAEATAALEGFTGAGRRFEERGRTAGRRPRLRRLRPPSDRGARHARGGEDARRPPRGGLLPAAPLLTYAAPRARVRARARAGRRDGRRADLPGARAAGGLSGRIGTARGGGNRRTRPVGRPVYWAPSMDDAERLLAAELGEGDALLTLGAGDVDRLAERLTARDGDQPPT